MTPTYLPDWMEMKLYRCRAVMPLLGYERAHAVKTYIVAARDPDAARARVQEAEPCAAFVTGPVETSEVLLTGTASISEREFAELRSACKWHERQKLRGSDPVVEGPDE